LLGFPSEAVVDAYLHPTVDESCDEFSWAKPDLDLLRRYIDTVILMSLYTV